MFFIAKKAAVMLALIVIVLYMSTFGYGSNILGIFPYSGYSHFRVFYPVMNGLAERGHNVTVISFYPADKNTSNYHEILLDGDLVWNNVQVENFNPSRSMRVMFSEFFALREEAVQDCDIFYSSNALAEIMRTHKQYRFDLLVMEMFNSDCVLGLAELLSLPVIGLSSCALMPWHYDRVGLPDFPSFIPSEFVEFSQNMDFGERFKNFIITKGVKALYRLTEIHDNQVIKEKLNMEVDVREIAKKRTRLVLVNQHYSLSGPRLLNNKVVEVGGIHISETAKELPKKLKDFILSSKNGVIFINWGSNLRTSSIDKKKMDGIMKAVNRLPQNIVWKWEDNETAPSNEKFFTSTWYSQKDVLCHPNVRAFWSHGGLLGVSETVHCGLPALVTPIYGDQFLNGKALESKGVGKILLYNDINEESVYKSLKEIVQERYKDRATKLSKLYRNREKPPLETALWWIEYVLTTNDSSLLDLPSVDMNWFTYYSLDVITVILVSIIVMFSFVLILLRTCFCGKIKDEKVKKQ